MSVGMQVLAEHVRAFELNNCIFRTFLLDTGRLCALRSGTLRLIKRTYVVPRLQAHAERFVDITCRYTQARMVLAVVSVFCTVLAMRQLPRYITL